MSNIITVFGATGRQGGSVIKAILGDSTLSANFKIRAITRDVSKPVAQALAKKGVEVISADMSSKSSVATAIAGSHSIFLVTTPNWGQGPPDEELTHGKNVTDAAKEAGVQHLIFSSLLNVTETSGGRLKHVPHFDLKAQVEQYIRASGVPCTFVLPGYFMSNFTELQMFRKGDDGVYTLTFPIGIESKFPLIDIAEDMGKFVVTALKSRSKVLNTQILAAAEYHTPSQILSDFEEVTGKKARFVQIDGQIYKGLLPPALADEMLENHQFIEDPGYYAGKSLEESLDLLSEVGLKPTSWKEFLEKNKTAIN